MLRSTLRLVPSTQPCLRFISTEAGKANKGAASLTAHLGRPDRTPPPPTTSPKKRYREQLRTTRHNYAHELLEKHGHREAAAAMKRAENEALIQRVKDDLAKEKQLAAAHEAQVLAMLNINSDATPKQTDRSEIRAANREAHNVKNRQTRLKHLLTLYNSTENFVTLENLDAKIDEMINYKKPPQYIDSLDEYLAASATDPAEIERRKEALKEAMGL